MPRTSIFAGAALAVLAAAAAPAAAQAPAAAAPIPALACAGCHGPGGSGSGAIPPIAGLDRQQFLETWAAFRADQRPASIMGRIARGYTDDEVAAMADYFASLR